MPDLFQGIGNSKVFLTVNQTGNNTTERGYNTEGATEFETIASGTTELPLADVPLVDIDGILYREFAFALNQTGGNPDISINEIQLFLADSNNLTGYDLGARSLPGATEIFDWVASGTDTLQVNDYTPGLDNIEMMLFVPEAAFVGGDYVYFQTSMGDPLAANDGDDKWVADKGGPGFCADVPGINCTPVNPVPAPATLALMGLGLLSLRLRCKT